MSEIGHTRSVGLVPPGEVDKIEHILNNCGGTGALLWSQVNGLIQTVRTLRKQTCRLCLEPVVHGYCERHATDMGVNKPLRSELMDPAAERRRLEGKR